MTDPFYRQAGRTAAARRNRPSLLGFLKGLAVTVVLLVGFGVSFFNCVGSLAEPPDPASSAIVEARAEQTQLMNDALFDVAAQLQGEVIGQSSVDGCYEGQRNWKRDDGYAYRCSLKFGVLVGLDGDFRAQMLDFDTSLRELGWESYSGEWPGAMVDDYWDMRALETHDGHVRLDRLPSHIQLTRAGLQLGFKYGPTDKRGLEHIDRGQHAVFWGGLHFYDDTDLMDVSEAVAAAPHLHLILVTVEGHYFQSE